MRSSKESSRFLSVEAVALPNLPQTFGGRERSKRGYAAPPLVLLLAFSFTAYTYKHSRPLPYHFKSIPTRQT